MSTPISADAAKISSLIFFNASSKSDGDYVTITCNVGGCGVVHWTGLDYQHPDVDWLGTAITHVAALHPEAL